MMPYLLPLEDNNNCMVKKKKKKKITVKKIWDPMHMCILVLLKCILNLLKVLKTVI